MDRFSQERLHWAFVMACVLAVGGAIAAALSGNMLVPIAIVLVAALAKARIVILDFMGLRRASGALRFALVAWPLTFVLLALSRSIFVAIAAPV
ncbi:MAG: cytochrome C oxidase subunit IV family protein [Rhizobium sp.]|nr:cytochrome C oxidase subunit IV family protein [Rhizobium sp.]